MEFKGTKGQWVLDNDVQLFSGYRNIFCNGVKIHESSNKNGLSETEISANALLISKAPEMLEMLIDAVNENKNGEILGKAWFNAVERIIKEATDL